MNLEEFAREMTKEAAGFGGFLSAAKRLGKRVSLKGQRIFRNITGQSSRGAARKLRAVEGAERQAARGMTMPEEAPWHAAKAKSLQPKKSVLQQRLGKIKQQQTRARTGLALAGGGALGGYMLGRRKKEEE
jgi:hypothetical protein